MPFCSNCGARVGDKDKFCSSCGAARKPAGSAAQPESPPPTGKSNDAKPQKNIPEVIPAGAATESSTGLKSNVAGLLCYLLGWITGIIFLVLEKNSRFVRFHAAQSLVTFGALNLVSIVLNFIPYLWPLSAIIGLLSFALWIVLMVKAYQGEMYKLPIAGDIASGIAGK